MNKFFIALTAIVLLAATAHDAEAKRLGGGMSSGMSRSPSIMNRQTTPPKAVAPTAQPAPGAAAQTPMPNAAPARSGFSRWMGPIAGLAAGIGIAALLSHFGMGEAMSNFVMILLLVLAVVVVLRLVFRRKTEAEPMRYAANGPAGNYNYDAQANTTATSAPAAAAVNLPAGFDAEGFLRQAKLNFVRLQAANDRGDMDDIRNFTTPEMFAEVQLQFQERGRSAQQTDVMQLDAELLDVTTEAARYIASVRFYGQLREAANQPPEAFDEVWHLVRPADGASGWMIAGIQQMQ